MKNVLWVCGFVAGCVSDPSGEDQPRVLSSQIAPPESLAAQAAHVRGFGGTVALVETVALLDTEPGALLPTGVEGVNTQSPEGRFSVRVIDALGGPWTEGAEVEIQTVIGEPQVVDDAGEPRTDWVVSDASQLWLRGLPDSGSYVVFVGPPAPAAVIFVAELEDGVVSGEKTRAGMAVTLESLRL